MDLAFIAGSPLAHALATVIGHMADHEGRVSGHARSPRSPKQALNVYPLWFLGVAHEGSSMKPDWELLADLTVFLDLEPEEQEISGAAFDRLGFPYPAEHY